MNMFEFDAELASGLPSSNLKSCVKTMFSYVNCYHKTASLSLSLCLCVYLSGSRKFCINRCTFKIFPTMQITCLNFAFVWSNIPVMCRKWKFSSSILLIKLLNIEIKLLEMIEQFAERKEEFLWSFKSFTFSYETDHKCGTQWSWWTHFSSTRTENNESERSFKAIANMNWTKIMIKKQLANSLSQTTVCVFHDIIDIIDISWVVESHCDIPGSSMVND